MPELLLCNLAMTPQRLQQQCGVDPALLSATAESTANVIQRYRPYIIDSKNLELDRQIARCLSPPPITRELTHLTLSFGESGVNTLANIRDNLREINAGLLGAAASTYSNRIGGFANAVADYQSALLEYRNAMHTPNLSKALSRQKAIKAFRHLQTRFRHELYAVGSQVNSRKGNPLTNAERGLNIARSSRKATKLNVTNQVQAHKLAKLARHTKYLGNGLAVIDFGTRLSKVHNNFLAGEHWERELFVQSLSFAASATAGLLTVNAGLSLLMFATPFGWAGLIIGGLIVAGVATAASMKLDKDIKANAGDWYDAIIELLY